MKLLSRLFSRKKDKILLNILTRTSNRPIGFRECRRSIENQSYKNIRHIVSYDDDADLEYLNEYEGIELLKVSPITEEPPRRRAREGYRFAPYNMYCNELMNEVERGWILFLDDDDRLLDMSVVQKIMDRLQHCSTNTILLWQMQYPNGDLLPPIEHMRQGIIKINHIGSPCYTFHSKHKNKARWDCWKAGDFFFLKELFQKIKHKKWITEPLIRLNNSGDFGNRNDIDL